MRVSRLIAVGMLLFAWGLTGAAASDSDLEVLLIRPSTENVIDVHQVTVTFNKAMVPLGDYEKLASGFKIDVSPKVDCQWRWLNGSTIACQLNQPLPPSNSYKITVPAGLKALDGSALKTSRSETFTTLKWHVVSKEVEWDGPDLPRIYLAFDQAMDLGSLKSGLTSACGAVSVAPVTAEAANEQGIEADRSYVVTFQKPIGLSRSCAIDIKGETRSASGSVPSAPFSFPFTTYPEFKIGKVECYDRITGSATNATTISIGGCNPDYGLSIELTAPTTGENLSGRVKTEPQFGWSPGGEGSPEFYKQYAENEHQHIALRSPMVGAGKHVVKLEGLKDRFGRPLVGPNEIQVTTTDFSPMLQLPDGYGVIEKTGPHKLGFSGVNARDVEVKYYHSHERADVKMWESYDGCEHADEKHGRPPFLYESQLKRTEVSTSATNNTPFAAPIDLDAISHDFKYGMFVGIMESGHELSGAPFTAHRVCSNFFTVVTDLGLMAKVGFYGSAIWVHSISTGEPLAGVQVGLYDGSKAIFEGKTDDEGFLEGPGAQKWDPERNRFKSWGGGPRLYVVAQSKDDFSVLPFETGRKGIGYYDFSQAHGYLSTQPLTESTNHIVHAITDRPLYKPGQKVNVKVFARHWEPRTYGLKPAREMEIEVKDALDKSIFKKTVKMSEFGTANFSFDLDPSSPLGTYHVMASNGRRFHDDIGLFDVQVFTLPPFKVKVDATKDAYEVGDSANFQTAARYHFGGGVPNATGEFTANFTPAYWSPKTPKWQGYTFENNQDLKIAGWQRPRATEVLKVASGKVQTDKNGDAVAGILLPEDQVKSYGKLEYGVAFKDDRGKSVAGYGATEVFYSRYQIGLKTPRWAYEAQEKIVPEVVVLDRAEKPVEDVEVELKLVHRTYKTVRRHGEGSYFYYDTRTRDQEIDSCTFKSGSQPEGCALKSKAAGEHFIVALARDPKGRLTQASLEKFVTGKEYVGWFRENHDRIDVIPDRASYNVGDTAKLLIKNPYEGVDALITLERFGILKKFRHKLTKGAEILSIPIDSKDYAPGFFVAVHLIKGRVSEKVEGEVDLGKPSFKMGMTSITVVDPDSVLKVAAEPEKEQYEPGDKAEVSLKISSPGGNDVAELSVAVVDEKILQLAGEYEDRYKLHDKFYSLRGGDVITSQMLSFLIGRRHFGKKGAPAGGDGDSGTKVRKNILPLAYWNPALRTDGSGKAQVHFTLPDNLTTWRVLVVAVDKRHRFGFGSGTFRAAKKIMIEPALPSFLTEGDKLNSRFTVFNRSGADAEVSATLKVTGADLVSPAEKKAPVANDGKAWLDWVVTAPYGKTSAVFEAVAESGRGKDGVRETIPIYPYASYDTFANYGSTTGNSAKEALQIPAGIRPELGGLEVLFSPTLISHLDDTFRYLFEYPYTCWEQTMVRAIALGQYVLLKQYLSIPELTREPKAWAAELLAEMPKFQYETGAMAYWKPDPRTVDPYLSVFTALGLQWLRPAKIKVPEGAQEKLFGYVRRLVSGGESFPTGYSPKARATVLAIAAAVLSAEGDDMIATANRLYQDRANLSLFGKSFLWMAASRRKETQPLLEGLKKEIYSAADLTSGSIQFTEQHDDGFVQILHSTTRTNCSLLEAMIVEDPKGQFVEPLVRWIIAGRKANRWNNTQENIFCQNALARYAAYYEKDTPKFEVTGKAMGHELNAVSFKSFKEKPRSESVAFPPEVVGKGSELVLEKKGKGRLYYTARLRIAYKDVRTSPVNSGMQVERTYFVKQDDGSWRKAEGAVRLKRGQLVRVQLKVNIPAVRNQVVLDDRLPAGLEPVNTALGGTSKEDAKGEKNDSAGGYAWNEDDDWYGFYSSGGFYHREMRLHAVQYFANFMSAGNYEIAYVAQAVATGEFNANPALIEQMYEPEVYGKSTPAQFIIEE